MSEGDAPMQERSGRWIKDTDRLVYRASGGSEILTYQIELLEQIKYQGLLIPEILFAYQPLVLVYPLERKTALSESENDASLQQLLSVLKHYCDLRTKMCGQLLDHQRIVLDEERIFLERCEGQVLKDIYFIYLPMNEAENNEIIEELQQEALGRLVEKTILAANGSGLLSDAEVAEWISSSYSNFARFQEICLALYQNMPELSAAPRSKSRQLAGERSRLMNAPAEKKVKIKARNPVNRTGLFLVSGLVSSLVLANLIMQLEFGGNQLWPKTLAVFFLLLALITACIALFHPKSPFNERKSRFQNEHETNLAGLLNTVEQKAANTPEPSLETSVKQIFPAYLMAVPSTQGERLRSKSEIIEAEVELFIFAAPLCFGADSEAADYSFGYKNEAALHSRIYSDETGGWLEQIDPETEIFIDREPCPKGGPQRLPDHCLPRIGPVVREYFRES